VIPTPHRPIHLVSVHRSYAGLILAGTKAQEIRLSKARRVPYGLVEPGDRLYFKVVSGPVVATCLAEGVESHDGLTPERVLALGRAHGDALCAPESYFQAKQKSLYATIVRLGPVEPVGRGPPTDRVLHGSVRDAWRVLPGTAEVYPSCLANALEGFG
jgi:hypothetical protein